MQINSDELKFTGKSELTIAYNGATTRTLKSLNLELIHNTQNYITLTLLILHSCFKHLELHHVPPIRRFASGARFTQHFGAKDVRHLERVSQLCTETTFRRDLYTVSELFAMSTTEFFRASDARGYR